MVTLYTTPSGVRCLGNTIHSNTHYERPKIFAACLSAYNNNKVHGLWVDATQPVAEIKQQISNMLCWSPYLNLGATTFYAIHCQEGFYNLKLDVNAPIEDIQPQALFIAKHGELGAKLIAHYKGKLENAEDVINQRYQGEYNSQLDYATQLFNMLYLPTLPEHTRFCINYKAFKSAIFLHYFFSIAVNGKVHVFFDNLGDPNFKECLEYFLKPIVNSPPSPPIRPTLEKQFSFFALELEAKVAEWVKQNEAEYCGGYYNRVAALEKHINGFHQFLNHLVDTWTRRAEVLQSETAGFDLEKAIQQLRDRLIEKHGCDLNEAIRIARIEYGGDDEAAYEYDD
jgi:antirestriction protein